MSGSRDDRRDIQALLSRIWDAVVRYRRMVAVMVVLAVLQTVFTKLPFLVIKPLMAEMGKAMGEKLAHGHTRSTLALPNRPPDPMAIFDWMMW